VSSILHLQVVKTVGEIAVAKETNEISQAMLNASGEGGAVKLWIDPGTAPAEEIANLFVAFSNLHTSAGGSGFEINITGETKGSLQEIELVPKQGN